jgi:DNA-binding transcriptional LysR family regulator
MDLRRLEYFLAVVEHGRVTTAASELHLAQPSLSQAIRALERDLGAELFVRNGRGLTPTPAGLALVEPARKVLRDLAEAKAAVGDVIELTAGWLDIATHDRLGFDPLAPVLAAFHRRYAGVPVRVHEPGRAGDLVRMLIDGRCELGLAYASEIGSGQSQFEPRSRADSLRSLDALAGRSQFEPRSPDALAGRSQFEPGSRADPVDAATAPALTVRRIGAHEVWLILPPGFDDVPDPAPLSVLDGQVLVESLAGFSGIRATMLRAMRSSGIRMRGALRTGHLEAIVPLVVAGAGVAFTSRNLAREAARAGAVARRLEPAPAVDFVLLHRPGALSPAARGFVSILFAELGLLGEIGLDLSPTAEDAQLSLDTWPAATSR